MPQISNASRHTMVLRVPKKYQFLIRSYAAWLSTYPEQTKLQQAEMYLRQTHETTEHKPRSPLRRVAIGKAQSEVFKHLHWTQVG